MAAMQTLAKTACQSPGLMDGAVIMGDDTDDQSYGFPFGNQRGDRGKAVVIVLGGDHGQRMGNAHADFAYGNTGAFFAKIESEYRAVRRSGIHAWPATSERLA